MIIRGRTCSRCGQTFDSHRSLILHMWSRS